MPALTLYPYQQRWVADKSRFKIGMMARQTGKTFTSTLEIVLDCLEQEAADRSSRWVILSRGERQAREAMEEGIKKHLSAFQAAFEAMEYDWEPEVKALEVRLPGGSRITALPANPDTARGFSANVFLDEFAFHKDSRKIWQSLFPVISAGKRIVVVSTPNGKGNKFYELMTDPSLAEVWSRHRIDIYQAVADGLPRNIVEMKQAIADPDAWAQEFELEWLDEASAWLDYDLIHRCEDEAAGVPDAYAGGWCFAGMDIAARGDLTVIACLEQVGDVLWVREMVELRRATFASQIAEADRILAEYRVLRLAVDQTGMGEMPVEVLQNRHGRHRVQGVLFSPAAKLDMATRLKERFEDRTIRIPIRQELRADLHSVKREAGPTGIPRLIAEREGGSHADRFWALALAASAAASAVPIMEFESTGIRRVTASDSMRRYLGVM